MGSGSGSGTGSGPGPGKGGALAVREPRAAIPQPEQEPESGPTPGAELGVSARLARSGRAVAVRKQARGSGAGVPGPCGLNRPLSAPPGTGGGARPCRSQGGPGTGGGRAAPSAARDTGLGRTGWGMQIPGAVRGGDAGGTGDGRGGRVQVPLAVSVLPVAPVLGLSQPCPARPCPPPTETWLCLPQLGLRR